ncbi:hypothetical protein [Actinoplanes regularis]|nr:hypothetical protein [Actinoplanes regularis]GLW34728.1 hypothetical protein Areg01_76650 [Actinoplanes regularis]
MYWALTVVPAADVAAITDTALLTVGDQRILAATTGAGNMRIAEFQA